LEKCWFKEIIFEKNEKVDILNLNQFFYNLNWLFLFCQILVISL